MTDLKFTILKTIYFKYPLREIRRNELYTLIRHNPILIKNALSDLQSAKYVETILCSDKYKLTDLGINAFEQEQDARKQTTKKKIQYIVTTILAILTLLSSFVLSDNFKKFIYWLISNKG